MRKYFFLLFILMFLVLASSCRSTKSLETDKEVLLQIKEVHDTTYIEKKDSIYHTIFQKGDTVYNTKYVESVKYRDRIVNKTDTLFQEREVIKEKTIEKKIIPTWCWWLLAINVLIFGVMAFNFYRKNHSILR